MARIKEGSIAPLEATRGRGSGMAAAARASDSERVIKRLR